MLDVTLPAMPANKPRYLMGVGTPDDILKSVARGIDMFDCVMPTRAGRHGPRLYAPRQDQFAQCAACGRSEAAGRESKLPAARDYSRAYLHHLVKSGEALGGMLLTWNNIAYYQYLMQSVRDAIEAGRFNDFCDETRSAGQKVICRRFRVRALG